MKFGWFPEQQTYETSTIRIEALPDFEESVLAVRNSGNVHEGWFCATIQAVHENSAEPCPPVPLPRFSLPLTHRMEYRNEAASSDLFKFLVTVFGWSQGLRLQPEGWGHFYRVALEPGKLVDFIVFEQDVPRVLDLADAFWHYHQTDGIADMMFGAIHWYLFSQSYYHYFERFMMQYIVLDTIYRIEASILKIKKDEPHFKRVEFLASKLNVPLPSWGKVDSKRSEFSHLRNELFHEAKFGGVPIGFGFPAMQGNILLSLQAFNSRLIAALLGAKGCYSGSSSETMQVHRLSID